MVTSYKLKRPISEGVYRTIVLYIGLKAKVTDFFVSVHVVRGSKKRTQTRVRYTLNL